MQLLFSLACSSQRISSLPPLPSLAPSTSPSSLHPPLPPVLLSLCQPLLHLPFSDPTSSLSPLLGSFPSFSAPSRPLILPFQTHPLCFTPQEKPPFFRPCCYVESGQVHFIRDARDLSSQTLQTYIFSSDVGECLRSHHLLGQYRSERKRGARRWRSAPSIAFVDRRRPQALQIFVIIPFWSAAEGVELENCQRDRNHCCCREQKHLISHDSLSEAGIASKRGEENTWMMKTT